jgi:peptidoglycan hydrolase-like protein with peptidoglycan-binding domain
MGTMFDTVNDPARTFAGLPVEAVAAYGNGRFANFAAAKREFPRAHLLEIDVSGQGIGNAGDFEPGDMAYSSAGRWAKQRLDAGVWRPVLYFSVSNWQAVFQSLNAAGVPRSKVRIWTAHYTGRPHLCSSACNRAVSGTADATQWGSPDARGTLPSPYAGHNVDVSITANDFWSDTAPPPPSGPPAFPGRALKEPPAMKGDDVRTWQGQMRHRGWPIAVDGAYGPTSGKVCRQFQAQEQLGVDGVVGPATWNASWTAPIT